MLTKFFCNSLKIVVKLQYSYTMRGVHLHKSIFYNNTDAATTVVAEKPRLGRNPVLNNAKNLCLVHRYYYYGKFTDKGYESIVKELSREFWLTETTIPRIIDAYYEELKQLKQVATSKDYFKKQWPHLVW